MSGPLKAGCTYLSVVFDLYSRQIAGWAMDKRIKKQLTLDALAMAYWRRKPPSGLLHHSDRGSETFEFCYFEEC